MSQADNYTQWNPAVSGLYEVYYLTWNHPATNQGFWLRYVIEAPKPGVPGPLHGAPRAELWFARFDPARPERTFGIHRAYPIDVLAPRVDPFGVAIDGNLLAHDHAIGELAGDGHQIRWNLRWEPAAHELRLLPDVLYRRKGVAETTVVSPNPRVAMTGTVVIDGETLTFDRAVLGQTHLWGRKHAFSWTWGRCADFPGAPDALLEILGVQLHRGGVTLPRLMLVTLDLDGEQHRLNQFRHVLRNRGRWTPGSVSFSAWSPAVRIEGELACGSADMIVAPYLDPDGTEVFCMNTEIGSASVVVYRRRGLGWREDRRLEAPRRAHFEVGGRAADPAVTREHVRVT